MSKEMSRIAYRVVTYFASRNKINEEKKTAQCISTNGTLKNDGSFFLSLSLFPANLFTGYCSLFSNPFFSLQSKLFSESDADSSDKFRQVYPRCICI